MGFIAITIYSLGHNFYHFLVAEIFFALSMALSSGADSAFMYDTLKDLGKEKQYKKVWGNYMMYGMIALGASNILGGIIGKYDLRWTLYASIPFFFLSMLTTLTLKEPQRHKRIFKQGYLWELFKIMKESLWENIKLRWLILFAGIAFAMNQAGLWLYQPYFEISGLDIAYFGVAFSLFHIIAGLASKFSHIIEAKLKLQLSLVLIILCTALGYFLMSYIVFWWSFIFIFLFQFVRGFSQPVIADAIHKVTDSSIRATVLSVQSLMGRLFYAILLPFIGWAADVYTITQALFLLGILTVGLGVVFGIMLWKNKSVET
jgi:MFS family permease